MFTFGFISGFIVASGLWLVGVLSTPRIKSWYASIKTKVEETTK